MAGSKVFKILVDITAGGNAVGVINGLMKSLNGLNVKILDTQGKLTALGKVGVAAGAFAGAGIALKALDGLVHAQDELIRQQITLAGGGSSPLDVAKATQQAWMVTKSVQGTLVSDNLKAIGDLRALFGSFEHIYEKGSDKRTVLEDTMRNIISLKVLRGGSTEDAENDLHEGNRAIEMMGVSYKKDARGNFLKDANGDNEFDAHGFLARQNLNRAIEFATRGRVDGEQLRQFASTGKTAAGNLSEEGFKNMVGLIGAQGGGVTGTQLATLNMGLISGQLNRVTATSLRDMGLLDMSKVHGIATGIGHGSAGGRYRGSAAFGDDYSSGVAHGRHRRSGGGAGDFPKQFKFEDGAISGESQLKSDPVSWVKNVLLPKLAAKGITDTDSEISWVQHAKFNRNASAVIAEIIRNMAVIKKERANVDAADKKDPYQDAQDKSAKVNMDNLKVAWHNMITSLAVNAVPVIIPALKWLTGALDNVGSFFRAHPLIGRTIGIVLMQVAAGLTAFGVIVGGAAVLAVAAFVGLPLAIVAGVAAAVVVFDVLLLKWRDIWGGITKLAGWIGTGVVGLWDKVKTAIPDAFSKIGSAISDELHKLPSQIWNGITHLGQGDHPAAAPIPPSSTVHVTVNHESKIDGKTVAKETVKTIVKAANRPQTGGNVHTNRQGFTPSAVPHMG
jgi:hypothetical protein